MSDSTTLMDLSDEILLEIAARVPFDASSWSSLSETNRRFNSIMTTESLPAKATKLQFPEENSFVDLRENPKKRLRVCKEVSEYIASLTPCLSTDRNIQKLISITILFLYTRELEGRLLPLGSTQNAALNQDSDSFYRVYLIHFSILRLLPTDFHVMLRYFALKVYERCYASDRVLPLLDLEPQDLAEKGQWLCDAGNFFSLETDIVAPQYQSIGNILSRLFSPVRDHDYFYGTTRCVYRVSEDGILPKLKTGRFLPSATTVLEATWRAAFLDTWVLPPEPVFFTAQHPEESPQILRDKFSEQVKHTKDLVSRIEAPDGQYVRDILDSLDLEYINSIILQQTSYARGLSGSELREAWAKELELLID